MDNFSCSPRFGSTLFSQLPSAPILDKEIDGLVARFFATGSFSDQFAAVSLQVFLQIKNRFDLSGDSFLVERFAMFEMSQMPSHANDLDMSFRQFPKLIFLQRVVVFRIFRNGSR